MGHVGSKTRSLGKILENHCSFMLYHTIWKAQVSNSGTIMALLLRFNFVSKFFVYTCTVKSNGLLVNNRYQTNIKSEWFILKLSQISHFSAEQVF